MDANYYAICGEDRLIRPKMESLKKPLPTLSAAIETFDAGKNHFNDISLNASNARRNTRDKRTQVITTLTAFEASNVGLDKEIRSYNENSFPATTCNNYTTIRRWEIGNPMNPRKQHHMSEVDVLEADGKRYVYGLPAYNFTQKDVTFSISAHTGSSLSNLVTYSNGDNTRSNNTDSHDELFQAETLPAYAHSFLLTAILSPDYSDITGDGITDDDLGNAVKFNYTRVNWTHNATSWKPQPWRSPFQEYKAHYNAGLRADNADDKGVIHLWRKRNMVCAFY